MVLWDISHRGMFNVRPSHRYTNLKILKTRALNNAKERHQCWWCACLLSTCFKVQTYCVLMLSRRWMTFCICLWLVGLQQWWDSGWTALVFYLPVLKSMGVPRLGSLADLSRAKTRWRTSSAAAALCAADGGPVIADRELSQFLCDDLPRSAPLHLPERWLGVHRERSSELGNTTTLLNTCVCVCVSAWNIWQTKHNYSNKVTADTAITDSV